MPTGKRNVPIAEPSRLHAIASPTPDARTSVGKHSGGKTPTRLLNADMVKVKTANATIMASVADDGSKLMVTNIAQVSANDPDRKSTRLNSSHLGISYAVFCLK